MRTAAARLTSGVVAVLLLAVLAPELPAQESGAQEPATNVDQIIRVDVAPDQKAAFEEGVKQYLKDLQALGAEWTWYAWEIETGKHSGSYYVGTFGHAWADFDEQTLDDPEAAQQSYRENVAPHIKSTHEGFWRRQSELSRLDPEASGPPAALSTVTFYKLKFGKAEAFTNAVKRVKQAADEAGHPQYWTVYRLQFGGGAVWAISSSADSWADLESPEKDLGTVLEEATSEYESEEIWEQFTGAVKAHKSQILQFREDLSLMPGAGGGQ